MTACWRVQQPAGLDVNSVPKLTPRTSTTAARLGAGAAAGAWAGDTFPAKVEDAGSAAVLTGSSTTVAEDSLAGAKAVSSLG